MFAALHSTMWAWAGPENLLDWISDETIFHFGRGAVGWEFSGEARTHTPPMMSVDLPGETMPAMVGVVVDEQAYTVGMDASGEAYSPVSAVETMVEQTRTPLTNSKPSEEQTCTSVGGSEPLDEKIVDVEGQACTRWNPSEEQAGTSVTC
jgi:hypothetical protein